MPIEILLTCRLVISEKVAREFSERGNIVKNLREVFIVERDWTEKKQFLQTTEHV